jgi:hypothetical protein
VTFISLPFLHPNLLTKKSTTLIMKSILGLFLLIVFTLAARAQLEITDPDYHFGFATPDSDWQTAKKSNPHDLYAYAKTYPDGTRIEISVQRTVETNGTRPLTDVELKGLGLKSMTHADIKRLCTGLPPDVHVSVNTGSWKGHTLYGMTMRMESDGRKMLIETLFMPLSPLGVNICVAAPPADEAQIRSILDQVVASVRGTPVWTMDAYKEQFSPSDSADSFVVAGYWIVAVVGFIALVVGGWLVDKFTRRKPAAKATGDTL